MEKERRCIISYFNLVLCFPHILFPAKLNRLGFFINYGSLQCLLLYLGGQHDDKIRKDFYKYYWTFICTTDFDHHIFFCVKSNRIHSFHDYLKCLRWILPFFRLGCRGGEVHYQGLWHQGDWEDHDHLNSFQLSNDFHTEMVLLLNHHRILFWLMHHAPQSQTWALWRLYCWVQSWGKASLQVKHVHMYA